MTERQSSLRLWAQRVGGHALSVALGTSRCGGDGQAGYALSACARQAVTTLTTEHSRWNDRAMLQVRASDKTDRLGQICAYEIECVHVPQHVFKVYNLPMSIYLNFYFKQLISEINT